jgi:integrase/recombinase XerD
MTESTTPLIKHIPLFLDYCKNEKKLSEKTQENYNRYLKKFIFWLKRNKKENILPHELTKDDIFQYKLFLANFGKKEGRSFKVISQKYYLIALRALLSYFSTKDIVSLHADKIKLPKGVKKKKTIPVLTPKQLTKLLNAPNTKTKIGLRDKAILAVLVSTGLKVSQLTKLNKDKIKEIPLPKKTISYIEEYLKNRITDSVKALFINYRSKKGVERRLTRRSIERIVKRYENKIHLLFSITPETLRWAYIRSLFQEQDYKPKIIKEPFTHKSLLVKNYNYIVNSDEDNEKKIRNNPPAWHIIESTINKERDWLKNNIALFPGSYQENPLLLSDDYLFRKIATLIVGRKIQAKELHAPEGTDLWNGFTKRLNLKKISHHGKEWHKKLMDAIYDYFRTQNCEVILEPQLNYGRADLGIHVDPDKILYVEVGTVSLLKIWHNLSAMKNIAFLIVPSEDYAIELKVN